MRARHLLLFVVACLLLGAEAPRDDGSKKDMEKLQGTWKVTAAQRGGEEVPAATLEKLQVVFDGDKITVKDGENDEVATFKLDATKKPATIDLMPSRPDTDKETVPGIYLLDGDNLKLCWIKGGKGRPRDFASKADSDDVLFMLKRAKK